MPVSDTDCGVGYVYNALKATDMCESTTCDVLNNAVDKVSG